MCVFARLILRSLFLGGSSGSGNIDVEELFEFLNERRSPFTDALFALIGEYAVIWRDGEPVEAGIIDSEPLVLFENRQILTTADPSISMSLFVSWPAIVCIQKKTY